MSELKMCECGEPTYGHKCSLCHADEGLLKPPTRSTPTPTFKDQMKTIKDVDLIESAESFWWCVEEDNTHHRCETEEEACAFQRGYRVANDLDPMTGEPA